ncbi:hypothetical protein KFL_007210060 [Klebsormidium nitens]|uniref:Uncharacterized protein n=1 Tax=Klebsormidium nitens TaxID=105231 RepID=A0A1Y1IPF1_KLENI|nr:hypothetical protein KFL_007210060 [Klebsormidium nitens]|eukprot:GAQ91061.1 hypothetical protein KFL_007210060 [Klebsormidium nitens]
MAPLCRPAWALLLVAALAACVLIGAQAQSTCIADPPKETGCEYATVQNLVLAVVREIQSGTDAKDVYAEINSKSPKWQFNGFYPFVNGASWRRVAHANLSSLGMYFDEAFEDVGIPSYPNRLQVYQGIAAAGGGLTQYLFRNGNPLSLKKAYVGPLLPDGSIVASGYTEIAQCTYAAYTACNPIAAYTLATYFGEKIKFAPGSAQPLFDATNKQVFPGVIPGGFYVVVRDADPASGYVSVAHGADFSKAGKTPEQAEAPDVAAALVAGIQAGIPAWISYTLRGSLKYTWIQPAESLATGKKYSVLVGYLAD